MPKFPSAQKSTSSSAFSLGLTPPLSPSLKSNTSLDSASKIDRENYRLNDSSTNSNNLETHISAEIAAAVQAGIGTTQFPPDPSISRILFTGGLGFIASWFVRHLVFRYPSYLIVCLDSRGYCSTLNNIKSCATQSNFVFIHGDVTDAEKIKEVVSTYDIDTIIHMAAESHVDNSFGGPERFTRTNVIGTQNLLEAAKLSLLNEHSSFSFPIGFLENPKSRKRPIRRFIHMSTDEVYGEVLPGAASGDLHESAILAPTNPYSASKAAGEMFVSAYRMSFGVPVVVVRCNNIYGPAQFPEKIIPKFVRLLQGHNPCTLHGDGTNTRRYLFVLDAVNALDTILHKGEIGKIYNAGSNTELSNIDIAKTLISKFTNINNNFKKTAVPDDHKKVSGDGYLFEKYIVYTKDRPFNDAGYAIDSSRLMSLGWKPLVDFEQGLNYTLDWYIKNTDDWWNNQSTLESLFKNNCNKK